MDNGIVLIFEPQEVIFPADAEILDDRGRHLARYTVFDSTPFVT